MSTKINRYSRRLTSVGAIAAVLALGACATEPYAEPRYAGDPWGYQGYDGYVADYRRDNVERRDWNSYYATYGTPRDRAYDRRLERLAERYDGDCPTVVTVQRGDTLSEIADYCDVPLLSILQTNRVGNPHNIEVGQRIRIPNTYGQVYDGLRVVDANPYRPVSYRDRYADPYDRDYVSHRQGIQYYTVRPGDTIAEISQRYNVTYDTIRDLNGYLQPRSLRVGQRIALPASATPDRYHRVRDPYDRDYDRRYRADHRGDTTIVIEDRDRRRPISYDRASYEPVVRFSNTRPAFGEDLRITVSNLPPNEEIILFIGDDRTNLREYHRAVTDDRGRYTSTIRLDNQYDGDYAMVGVQTRDQRWRGTSDRYRIYGPDGYRRTSY